MGWIQPSIGGDPTAARTRVAQPRSPTAHLPCPCHYCHKWGTVGLLGLGRKEGTRETAKKCAAAAACGLRIHKSNPSVSGVVHHSLSRLLRRPSVLRETCGRTQSHSLIPSRSGVFSYSKIFFTLLYMHGVLNLYEKKLIIQITINLRDEFFNPN
jgi:hypothetical protein